MATTEEGTIKSSQPTEVTVALLAVGQTAKEDKRKIYIFSNSWLMCNGIAIYMVIKMENH